MANAEKRPGWPRRPDPLARSMATESTMAASPGAPAPGIAAAPAVSVIVPAYNVEKTLAETLDSLLGQTMTDWEAIVVDDESDDGTAQIAARYAEQDGRFRYIRRENGGASAARNTGIEAARGRWLAFLDGDDWWDRELLSHLTALVRDKPDDHLAYCAYIRVTPEGDHTPPDWCPELAESPFEVLAERCEPAIHCVVVSRTLVQEVGAFDADLQTCEDWDLWQKIARTGAVFVGSPKPLAFYRMRNGSLSTNFEHVNRDALKVLETGGKADPRVPNPAPDYAAGVSESGGRRVTFLLALLDCAEAVGRGEDAAAGFDAIPVFEGVEHELDAVAECLYSGFLSGAGLRPDDAGATFPRARDALMPLIGFVGARSAVPRLADRIVEEVERTALMADPLHVPKHLDTWMAMRIDLAGPAPHFAPPPGVEKLHCRVCRGEKLIGGIDLPVFGPIASAALVRAMVDETALTALIRQGHLDRRVPFLLAAGCAVPAVAARMLGRWGAAREIWPRSARNLTKEVLRRAVVFALRTRRGAAPADVRSEDRAHAIAARMRDTMFAAERPLDLPRPPKPAPDPGSELSVPRGDTILRPADVAHERRTKVPILTYARIGPHEEAGDVPPDAFAEQLDTLRRHGHHTISLAEFWAHRLARRPLAGRPVIVAFHDADASVHRLAWPLLQRHGFTAEVFINVDRIGEGGVEPALAWPEIGEMHAQGARFGCFIFERDLWPRAVADFLSAASRHRALLERKLGAEIRAVALSGDYADALAVRGAQLAGFRQIFAGGSDFADVESCEITLPKVEVSGRESLGMFVEKLRYDSFDPDE
jgi:hypothetical protein